jgi:hypothetical protein
VRADSARSAVAPKPPTEFEDDTVARLTAAVSAIHAKAPAKHSQEELYRVRSAICHRPPAVLAPANGRSLQPAQSVEGLCMHKKDAVLHERLVEQCDAHVAGLVARLAALVRAAQRVPRAPCACTHAFANCSRPRWIWRSSCSGWRRRGQTTVIRRVTGPGPARPARRTLVAHGAVPGMQMLTIRSVFLYLDRTYVVQRATSQPNQASRFARAAAARSTQPARRSRDRCGTSACSCSPSISQASRPFAGEPRSQPDSCPAQCTRGWWTSW